MAEFYHVARRDITNIKEISLIEIEFGENTELKTIYKHYYPRGVSCHGSRFLSQVFDFSTESSVSYKQIDDVFTEFTYELIRRNKFVDQNSRFTSFFGCLSLEDARSLNKTNFNNEGTIYKVSCEQYAIYDMNLLNFYQNIILAELCADKYWKGEKSNNPFWEVLMLPPIQIIEKI